MTSAYATNSRVQRILDGFTTPALVDRKTGQPLEGQFPHTYILNSTAVPDPFYELQIVPNGTAVTFGTVAQPLKNFIGRRVVFITYGGGAGTTITLQAGSTWGGAATTIATTTVNATRAVLEVFVRDDGAGVPVVDIIYMTNITLS